MQSSFPHILPRLIVAAAWSLLCTLIIVAPIMASRAYFGPASWIYVLFSTVCHQMPDRSFIVAGFPLAICHRCSGIYLGLILGSLVKNPFLHRSPGIRRLWILASTLPLIIDAALPFAGIGSGHAVSRFLTGLLFGTMLSSLFLHGIIELLAEARQRLHLKGGLK